jgi:predicted P-loop ATPase
MMSTRSDHYRPSYGRNALEFPRQCAFAGTTNSDDWGTDDTGLRRFWPIRCGEIHVDDLAAMRDQLFAEALVLWRAGASWWDTPESAADQQAERQQYDDWTDAVTTWIDGQRLQHVDFITVPDIASAALKIPLNQLDKSSQMRIARILRLAGWQRRTVRQGSAILKAWYPGGNVETNSDVFVP